MGAILIVDDEADLAAAWREMLVMDGHHVMTALSGAEAVSLMTENQFDLVITDGFMGAPDGADYVASMTHTLQGHRNVIVASGKLTAFAEELKQIRTLEKKGVRKFMPKPVDALDLIDIVRESLADDSFAAQAGTGAKPFSK